MRGKVTLDPDTSRLVERTMRERGLTFTEAVNEAIRRRGGRGGGQLDCPGPSILASPMIVDEATSQVETWLGAPAAVLAEPTARHDGLLRGLLRDTGTAGNLTTDAHIAALAIEHGAEIVSYDRDFARFAGVRHRLPGVDRRPQR